MICILDCERRQFSRGLCRYHYHINWHAGTLDDVALPRVKRKRVKKTRGIPLSGVGSKVELAEIRRKLYQKQKGRCAICDIPGRAFKNGLHLDHDHYTGEIRGLLCGPCNSGIGLLGDTKEAIAKALAYLD